MVNGRGGVWWRKGVERGVGLVNRGGGEGERVWEREGELMGKGEGESMGYKDGERGGVGWLMG